MNMSYNWWGELEWSKDAVRALVAKYHPSYGWAPALPITAPGAEAACEAVRVRIAAEERSPLEEFDAAYASRDAAKLHQLLEEAWLGMPESVDVRSEPGFGALCDLCSEYEEEQP